MKRSLTGPIGRPTGRLPTSPTDLPATRPTDRVQKEERRKTKPKIVVLIANTASVTPSPTEMSRHGADRKSLHTHLRSLNLPSRVRQNHSAPRSASRKSPATDSARSRVIDNSRIHSAIRMLRMRHPRQPQSFKQSLKIPLRASDSLHARATHLEIPLRPTAARRRRIGIARRHQSLFFQTIESVV